MKRILVLGAGQSAPYLIHYLLENAEKYDWFVTVGDLDVKMAENRVNNHARGKAISFNVFDNDQLNELVNESDLVCHMLAPAFVERVAKACLENNTHHINVSYTTPFVKKISDQAEEKGLLFLSEMGLDPGIDHMSAMRIIQGIRDNNGKVKAFWSYGSGVPAEDAVSNPMKYFITWNPANVVMAGGAGAQYLEDGRIKMVPYHHLFEHTWPFEVDGIGEMEAYPNRDSLGYLEIFELKDVDTMVRGTLRWPGYCEVWKQVVNLGMNMDVEVPNLGSYTYRELVEMFLPRSGYDCKANFKQRVADYLNISPTGVIMQKLDWLGLLSDKKVPVEKGTVINALVALLQDKLALPKDQRDMVILAHKFIVEYEDRHEIINSTFVDYGTPGKFTAMSRTVGAPAAIAAKLLLTGELKLRGSRMPIEKDVYEPVLNELESMGLVAHERVEVIK